ncbi:methyltransferase domain-containing protein, partial [Bacteroidota bacterium]
LIVRNADYYPVTEGYENILQALKQKVKDGYSILVFPEGGRSENCEIKRFHKGSFYLADKLNLELLPVIIHGAGHCLTKVEFFLRSGSITVKMFDRINIKNGEHGNTYLSQAKSMAKFYREEFDKMKLEYETPNYFRNRLIKQYIYKGPILEWYTRIKLKLEKNYTLFNDLIPKKASIVDIGCGYGYLPYMLNLFSNERIITGVDYDKDKIDVAAKISHDIPNLNFIHTDIDAYELPNSDVFILNDVLHYMPEENQLNTIRKCISKLNKNGKVIIRDADANIKRGTFFTKLTELYGTRSGFNKMGFNRLFFIGGNKITDLVSEYNMDVKIIDNTKFTSNLIYFIEFKNNKESELNEISE